MSNRSSRKSGSGTTNTAPQRPSAEKARPANGTAGRPAAKTPAGSNGKIVVTPARPATKTPATPGARPRGSQPIAKPKAGFRLRPLDLALIALVVVGVGALVWAVVNNDGQGSASDPRVRLGNRGQITAPAIGQAAPDIVNLPATDGTTYTLSQLRGKVVLLELMAPWCPHCQEDTVLMNEIYDAYQGKNVQILAVNATPFGRNYENKDDSLITADDQKWFHDTFGVKFPVLFDKDVKVADDYGVTSFPTLYVIGADGNIAAQPDAPVSKEGISKALDDALTKAGGAGQNGQPVAALSTSK